MTRAALLRGAALGALVGLAEGWAIVRYDWIHQDPGALRALIGLGWLLAIVGFDAVGGALLGLISRGRWWLMALLWSALVSGPRAWTGDRFEWWSLACVPVAVGVAALLPRWRQLVGVVAVALALQSLWGRVPVYGTPLADLLPLWGMTSVLPLFLGSWGSRAVAARGREDRTRGLSWTGVLGPIFMVLFLGSVPNLDPGLRPTRPGGTGGDIRGKNLIVIVVDTLRADHVAPYGRSTPGTARLAAQGTTFTDAVTVIPKTTQSVAAQQTGRYPVHNGVRVLKDHLPQDERTVAELLGRSGYDTAAFVHNGWIMRGRGFEQGFHQFWSFFELERAFGPLRLTGLLTGLDALTTRRIRAFDGNTDAAVAVDRAIDWLDQRGDRPFYLYLHTFDPHWPYRPPGHDGENAVNNIKQEKWSRGQMIFANPLPDAVNDRAVELYGHEVNHNDDQVLRLLDWLDQAGLDQDTVVVFTADHGHHLGEHDYWYHHGELLYEPGVRIPLIVRAPGGLPAGALDDRPVRNIDLAPTLLGLTGAQLVESPPAFDGIDLRSEDPGPAYLETDISYFRWNKRRPVPGTVGKVRGLRQGDWKLHYTPAPGAGQFEELYDLSTDPDELRDRSAEPEQQQRLGRMIVMMAAMIDPAERAELAKLGNTLDGPPSASAEVGEIVTPVEQELDANERAMLEALGYIDE